MDTTFKKREKQVGTFLILITITLLTILLVIGRGKDWFKRYVTYYTVFNESYNLQDGAQVRLYSTEVGSVESITIVEDQVRVELTVIEDYAHRIRADSIAVVDSTALLYGTDYVSIRPGSPEAELLPEGAEIESAAKQSPMDLLNEFGVQETASKIVTSFNYIVDIINRIKDPDGPLFSALDNVNKTTHHVEGITREMQAGRGTVGQLLKSTQLLEMIQAELARVDVILENVGEASTRTPQTMDKIQVSLDRVNTILGEVIKSVSSISVVLKEIEDGSGEIPKVTQSAKRGIEEMRDTLRNADKILQSLQKNFFIRSNLPPDPEGEATDAGIR